MFEDVTVDCLKTEKFNDNIVIFKNKLNDNFVKKHTKLISGYKEFVSEKSSLSEYSKLIKH